MEVGQCEEGPWDNIEQGIEDKVVDEIIYCNLGKEMLEEVENGQQEREVIFWKSFPKRGSVWMKMYMRMAYFDDMEMQTGIAESTVHNLSIFRAKISPKTCTTPGYTHPQMKT
ncbi:unnamed protein product [Discosporangium mesarthrocarpum]